MSFVSGNIMKITIASYNSCFRKYALKFYRVNE